MYAKAWRSELLHSRRRLPELITESIKELIIESIIESFRELDDFQFQGP